ncbi:Protein of unknown function [Arboricoccus pini]|uniref:DUF1203 domain-containing protein n=1 Tax=Arboricoccus pini TaxID=1963835 RepID=A0A212QPW7_9PROT|nr:DUF1203 domain-containing protein [Arboricoccus pini]SNB61487.1 Protein of unknown function [Arboricoccus pini]
MPAFRCLPIPSETAARFRETDRDDRGQALRRLVADGGSGYPCRHCLDLGKPGQTMLLGSYNLPRPLGIYWTPSPIFVHADDCRAFTATNAIPPALSANGLVSIRAYDADDQCLYELGQVCTGSAMEAPLLRALSAPRTAFVNVHTARPGCLLAAVRLI